MAVVHYKFKNSVDYDSLAFDGLSISLRDFKQGVLRKKKLRAEDTDLQVINAQTLEEYSSPSMMIPKNTSLILARIPVGGAKKTEELTPQTKAKKWAAFRKETQAAISAAETGGYNMEKLKQSSDLVNAESSEIEKIAEMIKQSTKDFDPSNYTYKVPTGTPNPSYICRRCGKGGHFIQNCPNEPMDGSDSPSDVPRIKRPTGIPMDSMVFVNEPLPGTYQTHSGKYAVPKIDVEAYVAGKKERPPFLPEVEKKPVILKKPIPKELKCPLCDDLAKDAVLIPCCGISYCDECIRDKLLETEDHVCPSCDSMDVSPDGLIPNQMLRSAVTNFQNETGYVKIAQAQAKVAEAAKAAALHAELRQKRAQATVVPRGPSVLDYRPPPKPPTPPVSKPAPKQAEPQRMPAQQASGSSAQTPQKPPPEQEPPTPTLDEPPRSLGQTSRSSSSQSLTQGTTVPTLVSQGAQPVGRIQRRPNASVGYDPYYKPSVTSTAAAPVAIVPPYPPPMTSFPPPIVPSPYVPPPVPGVPAVVPPVVPGFPPALPPRPTIPPPPLNLPKPLSEAEFLKEKNRILMEELKLKDPLVEFTKKLEQRRYRSVSRSRSRSRTPRGRSRSLSRPRYRSRSRARSYSRSPRRSYTPRRSLTPRRSYSPRRYSPRRSRSPRYSPRRYYSPRRSRSPRRSLTPRRSPRPRYRSYSRSPARRSYSRSRSLSWDRKKSPVRRSYSRSPVGRGRSPYRRSRSRGRFSPVRSPVSYRRSPLRRSLSRSRTPVRQRSPRRFSPVWKRSPLKGSREKSSSRAKSPKAKVVKKKSSTIKDTKSVVGKASSSTENTNININNNRKSSDRNKENIPAQPVQSRSNNIVVSLVETPTVDSNEKTDKSKTLVDTSAVKNSGKIDKKSDTDIKPIEESSQNNSNKSIEKSSKGPSESKDEGKVVKENVVVDGEKKPESSNKNRKSRSKSKEKSAASKQAKPKEKKRPVKKREKTKSVSVSPERVKEPLKMPFRGDRERLDERRDRFEGGRDRFEGGREAYQGRYDGRGGYGRDWDRDDPYFRGRQNAGYRGGREYRGRGMGPDYRAGLPGDFRGDYRGPEFHGLPPPPLPQGDYRGFPPMNPDHMAMMNAYSRDYPQRGSPAYTATSMASSFPYPPPRDPREDPNWQGLVRDEDIVRFEQYKQMYDYYSRTYGFPPPTSTAPSGQTPPQGPPPAPPGTTPLPVPREESSSPSKRRSVSPRRHRSKSPSRRDKERRDKDREYRDKRSPERRKEERSPDRRHDSTPEKKFESESQESERDTTPEKKLVATEESEKRKEKKAKKKREKGESGEKKKKKKRDKDKSKSKKEKAEKKARKLKAAAESLNIEEPVKKKAKRTDSQAGTETERSDSESEAVVDKKETRRASTAASDSSDHENASKAPAEIAEIDTQQIKTEIVETELEKKPDEEGKAESQSENVEAASDKIKVEPVEQRETVVSDEMLPEKKKRLSLKRIKPEVESEEVTDSKKVKLDEAAISDEAEKMDTSPAHSEGDDIPHPEDELMLYPPEVSKWEKEESRWDRDDDPYGLSPEPAKVKQKWKPEKPTLLPSSVIRKAENVFAQKTMKPTTVSSTISVIQPVKKEVKSEIEAPVRKREKSPVAEQKRRVFMEPQENRDDRKINSKQHSVKITVTGNEKRKVAAGEDLRNKLREKRRESEHSHDAERLRDSRSDRNVDRRRKDSQGSFRDRRDSREYERQDNRGSRGDTGRDRDSRRILSRKESVIDDSKFEPDYEDRSEENDSEESSSDSSSEEEVVQKKHRHKKNKHKKDKKQKKKKDKKRKKHKGDKSDKQR